MKFLCGILILLALFLTACSQDNVSTEYPLLPYPDVVVWNNVAYVVTDKLIAQEDVVAKIGEVKRYIDPNQALPEKDGDSTVAPVGSVLYEIKDVDSKLAFAVEIEGEVWEVRR